MLLKILEMTKHNYNERCDETQLGNPKEQDYIDSTIQNLKDMLRADKDLMAITSAHVGADNMRIICIKFARGDIRTFINPLVFGRKGIHLSRERQIGGDKTEFIVPRNDEIHVAYQTPVGKEEANSFMGVVSEIMQQMIDVLDGILLCDYGLEVLPGFDDAPDEDKQQIISMYLDTIQKQSEAISKEIENNKEVKNMDKAIDFITQLSLGQVETIEMTPEEKERLRKTK